MQFFNFPSLRVCALTYFCIFCLMPLAQGQLKCKAKSDASGKTETCYHASGKISTVRFWDVDERNGMFEAYRSDGGLLAKYDLRRFAGHASVYVTYFPNGQVQVLEYSSAPDGGIQFWHIIHHFDEQGNETGRQDLSQPDGFPRLTVPQELLPEVPQPVVPQPPKIVDSPPVLVTKEIQLIDLTGKAPMVLYQWTGDTTHHQVKWTEDGAPVQLGQHQMEKSKALDPWIQFRLTRRDTKRMEIVSIAKNEWLELFVVRRRLRSSK